MMLYMFLVDLLIGQLHCQVNYETSQGDDWDSDITNDVTNLLIYNSRWIATRETGDVH